MHSWTFYPAFLATFLSVSNLSFLVHREHDYGKQRTLSQLAADKPKSLLYFRIVLWACGTLFAVSMYFYIIPRITYGLPQAAAWSLTYFSELALSIFPSSGKTKQLHDFLAVAMGVGMAASAYLFAFSLTKGYMATEMVIASVMTVLAALTIMDKKRFIFYELPFIFLAHTSILIALFALK